MKIIILGAGQVGGSLAEHLAADPSNQITVIDNNEAKLKALRERVDVGTVFGEGAYPHVLAEAGADDADLLIAVTFSDETNMLACQVAYTVFQTPTKIARIRSGAFSSRNELFANAAIPIDVLISPEELLTRAIERLIQYPGTLQVLDFADGRVQVVTVVAEAGGLLVNKNIRSLKEHLSDLAFKIAAIYHKGEKVTFDDDTVIHVGDEVFFCAESREIDHLIGVLRDNDQPNRRVVIAGGGNVGAGAAKILEANYQVKVIDRHEERAELLAESLDSALVLVGDATDRQLLLDEYIEDTDVFCAVTENDETNIMSSILAKRLGANKSIALINRLAYVDLVEGGEIDVVISPQAITVSHLLRHIRRGDVVKVHALRHGAEAIEAVAHGDEKSSKVVGRSLSDIELPMGVMVMAIVRGDEVIMAHEMLMVENEDHLLLFLPDQIKINEVEKLFQVNVTFL